MVDTSLESAAVALQASVFFAIVTLSWPGFISLSEDQGMYNYEVIREMAIKGKYF